MAKTRYAVAIGSNRYHGTYGSPTRTIAAAINRLSELGFAIEAISRVRTTAALGPSGRSFANAVIILATEEMPVRLLEELKCLERHFGRRAGRRWGARILDLDIVLWSEGCWEDHGLVIPHPEMRHRDFVLGPLAEIAPDWRDPISRATIRQLLFRHQKPHPVDPHPAHP